MSVWRTSASNPIIARSFMPPGFRGASAARVSATYHVLENEPLDILHRYLRGIVQCQNFGFYPPLHALALGIVVTSTARRVHTLSQIIFGDFVAKVSACVLAASISMKDSIAYPYRPAACASVAMTSSLRMLSSIATARQTLSEQSYIPDT